MNHRTSTLLCAPLLACSLGCTPRTSQGAVAVEETPTSPRTPNKQGSPQSQTKASIDRETCGLPESIREPDWPRTLTTGHAGEPPVTPTLATLAILPDTQYYVSCREAHFATQTAWLASQFEKRNIQATLHLGDLTEHNTRPEWDFVKDALAPLQTRPLLLATGNHDHGDGGTSNKRGTLFGEYFGKSSPQTSATLVRSRVKGDVENAYYRLPLGETHIGVLVLEWSPRDAVVTWAKELLAEFPDERRILLTHAYMFHDDTRYDMATKAAEQPWNPLAYGTAKLDPQLPYSKENRDPAGAHDGEMLWKELVEPDPGFFLTLNGHVLGDGAAVLSSRASRGNLVHQMLVNYQMLDEGGLGYLRLLEISPDGTTLTMKTYSPSLDYTATGDQQSFSLAIDPPLIK